MPTAAVCFVLSAIMHQQLMIWTNSVE